MKVVKIQGGLGNQLFGLAFARSVARLGGAPVALDLAAYRGDRFGRAFELADLARDLGDFAIVRRPLTGGRLATRLMRWSPRPGYVCEGEPPADAAALNALIAPGTYFNGYWQDERYIVGPDALIDQVRALVFARAGAVGVRDVAIHYRTYREERRPAARRGPDGDYVRAALARIEARLGPASDVCLVSDAPAVAVARIGDIGRPLTVLSSGGPFHDMALLMKARALILTNSSFSWWGGFCGEAAATFYPEQDGFVHYPAPAARFERV